MSVFSPPICFVWNLDDPDQSIVSVYAGLLDVEGQGFESTHVSPVERLIPANMVETRNGCQSRMRMVDSPEESLLRTASTA